MPDKVFNTSLAIKAQKMFCKVNDMPHFAPINGRCYRCGKNIYEPYEKKGETYGIDAETAGKFLITGCPHCNRSFCD